MIQRAFGATEEIPAVRQITDMLKTPQAVRVCGCIDAQKAHLCKLLSRDAASVIYICELENKAREAASAYRFFDDEALYYPARDFLFDSADLRGDEIGRQRATVYRALGESGRATVFTTPDALMDAVAARDDVTARVLRISVNQTIDPKELAEKLSDMGYIREYQANSPGEYAVRGGIVDIWPLTKDNPFRVEFFDDEIETIRAVDPESQRSKESVDLVVAYPYDKGKEGQQAAFLSYFDPENTIIFFDNPDRCFGRMREVVEEISDSISMRNESGEGSKPLKHFDEEQMKQQFVAFPRVLLCPADAPSADYPDAKGFSLTAISVPQYKNNFTNLIDDLKKYKVKKERVLLISASRSRAVRLSGEFMQEGLNSFFTEDLNHEIKPGEVMVSCGRIARGFSYPKVGFTLISDGDLYEKRKRKIRRHSYEGEKISSFSDLHTGDYVVHENHGLGIYRGIEQISVEGTVKDFLKIEYDKGGILYVLVTQLNVIQKYSGSQGARPRLSTLGGNAWKKTKSRVKESVDTIATELVELYAKRQQSKGFVYGKDTVWQKEFEECFPYDETGDQLRAIEAVKTDMESDKIMDRLLCGDVGFGKTEVAIRAAFKAVQDGKQVAYLVPTTILAQQHYNTFAERMKGYPVRVDLLCRFRTKSEQSHTVADLKKGAVDIVIGTHRLLSKDVEFKDLGLLVIDEEQRFGVSHKEKIKSLKENVDVLSLTATPIPRTLHMSLIGIRDMSVLEEPPSDRHSVQTFVTEYDKEIVREAISREMKRHGQVFYVYNKIETIERKAQQISELVPDARVAYAHGRMDERELEDIMYEFIMGHVDILVSTTIIETGLDISNVNTMIIEDADRMGLSQLYQLRGRVGRSDRLAYAFLMYRKDKVLKEVAEKRLGAIREFSALGSGIRIAMRDLEIRGAGNLLGKAQSGNMEAVGYDLYCKMLNEAVNSMKGIAKEEDYETAIDINVDAYIPDTYISDEFAKLDIYKRISLITDDDDVIQMEDELSDRFGKPPESVEILVQAARAKAAAHEVYITRITENRGRTKMELYEKAKIDLNALMEFLGEYPNRLYFNPQPKPMYDYVFKKDASGAKKLRELTDLFVKMKERVLIG